MRKLILLSVLSASTLMATAQNYEPINSKPTRSTEKSNFRFGAFFAPNISWMRPTASKSDNGVYDVKSNGSKVGFTWGVMVDYAITENYFISSGFQVNTTGGKIQATNTKDTAKKPQTVYDANFNYTTQYFELPVHLKLKTDELGNTKIKAFGEVGITLGVNIGKKATYNVMYTDAAGGNQTKNGDHEKIKGSLSLAPFTAQLNIGGGIERPVSDKLTAYLAVFFNNGFAPDATNPANYDLGYLGSFSDGKIRQNSVAIRVGLIF